MTNFLKLCFFIFCPLLLCSCGKDDEPVGDNFENFGEGNLESNYNPNSDHALSLALKEKGFGTITNVKMETAIIGKWLPVWHCAAYWQLLDNNSGCDDYDGGYQFNNDGLCYYLNAMGEIEGNSHSWSISDDMLRIYFRGNADDRIYPKMTTKGYLILQWHGSPCWKIYKKF